MHRRPGVFARLLPLSAGLRQEQQGVSSRYYHWDEYSRQCLTYKDLKYMLNDMNEKYHTFGRYVTCVLLRVWGGVENVIAFTRSTVQVLLSQQQTFKHKVLLLKVV
ncbi:hypothetical protein FOCC_FOCC011109 [Frankliniella occidentalis]|nr:hypothetical protein FOCC_FOCC011109 [Frankliniella occidentalis]